MTVHEASAPTVAQPATIAADYVARGWAPIPIPHKQKRPTVEGWQRLRVTGETVARYFNGDAQNIGVLLGEASGGLTDVDLDCPQAILAAPFFLPPTRRFGRASKRFSHWLYVTDLSKTMSKATEKFQDSNDKDGLMLEVRIGAADKGAQTVFPGSTHTSGEAIDWENGGRDEVTTIAGAELLRLARRLAAATILARHFPGDHARHDAGLKLGGFLGRCGFTEQDAKVFAEAVAVASGQPMDRKDVITAVVDGIKNHANGGHSPGLPSLKEVFGEAAAKKAAEWLNYAGGAETESPVPDDGRPTIQLTVGETERIVDEVEAALMASGRGLYRRGGRVVCVGYSTMPTHDERDIEVQVIEERGDAALLEDMEAAAHFLRFVDEKLKLVSPGTRLAATLKQRTHRLRLPPLNGVINSPIMRANGEMLDAPGYDAKTGLLFDPRGVVFPPVPDRPDKAAGKGGAQPHQQTHRDLQVCW
jgi:hypothetical protein